MRVCRFLSLAAAVLFLAVLNGAQIIKVSWSSAQDPNTPFKALSGGKDSRWSAQGRGQWMQMDLDGSAQVDRVEGVFNVEIGSMPSKSKSQEMVRNGRPFLIRKVRARVMGRYLCYRNR